MADVGLFGVVGAEVVVMVVDGDALKVNRCTTAGSGDPGADVGHREGGVVGEDESVNADTDLSMRPSFGDWVGEVVGESRGREVGWSAGEVAGEMVA